MAHSLLPPFGDETAVAVVRKGGGRRFQQLTAARRGAANSPALSGATILTCPTQLGADGILRHMLPFVDPSENWSIRVHDKEMLEYWEGEHGYIFDCAWGVSPGLLFVPPEPTWNDSVPSWMRGRRDVVLRRLRDRSGHDVVDDDRSYRDWKTRLLPRGALVA